MFGNSHILGQLFRPFTHDYFGTGMLTDIFARFGIVGGVNTGGDTSGGNGTKVGKQPGRGIETNNVDRVEFLTVQCE